MSVQIRESQLNLQSYQQSESYPMKHEWVVVPSTSQFAFGGMGQLDFKEKGNVISDIAIQYNVSAITGLTGVVAGYPHFNPAWFWADRIEVVQNSIVIDTIYPQLQFLQNNLFQTDMDRVFSNNLAGNYASNAQRTALATTGSNYYASLWTYFKQGNLPLLTNAHEISFRVYMAPLANCVTQSTLTGSPVAVINFANLLVKVSRMQTEQITNLTRQITARPAHYKFLETKYGTHNINSGSTNVQFVLSSVSGKVAMLFFIVRPQNALTGDNQTSYVAIKDFQLLNNASTNIVGGQAINSTQMQLLLRSWTESSYCAETALGLVNNNANIYMFAFCADPIQTAITGGAVNTYRFSSNEQIQINFNSALGSNHQLEVYALVESVIEVGINSVKKLSL